jgi:hypothetical protein
VTDMFSSAENGITTCSGKVAKIEIAYAVISFLKKMKNSMRCKFVNIFLEASYIYL